jgi:DNA-binding phage protein
MRIADRTSLGCENLYTALTPGLKARFDVVMKVLQRLGVTLSVNAV